MKEEIRVHVVDQNDRKNYSMRYTDPITGQPVKRTTGTADKKQAERIAAKWEHDLNAGRYFRLSRITWREFRERYEEEKLSSLAENTQRNGMTALNQLERYINPARLANVNEATLSTLQERLRKNGKRPATIDAYLAHIGAALRWAVEMKMLPRAPKVRRPKLAKGKKFMRGRPITAEEFDRMLAKVPAVRPDDPQLWCDYLRGLWLSGLRLTESLALSWDFGAEFAVDLSRDHPVFRIYAEAQKSKRNQLLPMTPDFAEFLLDTPETDRHGRVFKLSGRQAEGGICEKWAGMVVSAIGRRAGVVVDKAAGKCASAHDLRRAFGTRWAPRVKPVVLQRLMRHASIQTTMAYYVDLDADELAADLWRSWGPEKAVSEVPF